MKPRYHLTLLLKLSVLLTAAGALSAPAFAQSTYSGTVSTFNVGKLIIDSATYSGAALSSEPANIAPHLFYVMDQRTDLKPRSWSLQNPLAPSVVTQAIHNRWTTIDPTAADATLYQIGSPVSKNMAAYWEVDLLQTSLSDLLKFNLLFLSSRTDGESFTPEEQEKLRKLVEAGGVVWVDDGWGFRISDTGRFFLPNLQFHGSHIGALNPSSTAQVADASNPLLNTPFTLTQDDMNNLGDKDVGEYYHTGFVAPGQITGATYNDSTPAAPANQSQPEPDVLAPVIYNAWSGANVPGGPYPYVSAGRYGAGYVIITSGDVGDAINAPCDGTMGYDVPGPDWDKNGGSVCGDAISAAPAQDLKFAYNTLGLASNFSTYRNGPEHAAYSAQSVSLPLYKQWKYPLAGAESVQSDPVVIRGQVFAGTTAGRLICLPEYPPQIKSATGPMPLWIATVPAAGGSGPLSPLVTLEVNLTGAVSLSTELLVCACGYQVFAYNANYNPNGPNNSSNPQLVWTWTPPDGSTDPINSAPVEMEGMLFVTTQHGSIWEINPSQVTGTLPFVASTFRSQTMPTDVNNPTNGMPAAEPSLHYAGPKWTYMAAPPALGYVLDRTTSDQDPTLVLCLYSTATQIPQNGAPLDGGLLQFPIRIANENFQVGSGIQLTNQSWQCPLLKYNPIKNPEMVQFSIVAGSVVTTSVTPVSQGGPAGTGTMQITIEWPGVSTAGPCYYAVDGGGNMLADYSGTGNYPGAAGTWMFSKPTQTVTWNNNGAVATRLVYNRMILAPVQFEPGVGMTALTADCSVHVNYDVDETDPLGTTGVTSGPAYHPEMTAYDLQQNSNTTAGPAVLGPPSIGLDDSVYFGDELGILYSVSHYGAHGLVTNWKYFTSPLTWQTSTGAAINPVTLANVATNSYTTDIQAGMGSLNCIRTAPTTGGGNVYVTVTNLTSHTSQIMAFNGLEFEQASTNAPGGFGQGGAQVTFQLQPLTPEIRNITKPVWMLGQFDPLLGRMRQFFPPNDFTVDPASMKVTLNRFGAMYANLPIYVWYNLANGQFHTFASNPPTPPDEVHNVLPGVNSVPYDRTQKYLFPSPNGPFMESSFYYTGGYPHPPFIFPDEQICNILWQFPDPVWNAAGVNWNNLVYPTLGANGNGVAWVSAAVPSFGGASLGSPPASVISDASPTLVGNTLLVGITQLTAPSSVNPSAAVQSAGFLGLAADPRGSLQGYTDPEDAAIYSFSALTPASAGAVPTAFAINDPNDVVNAAVNAVTAQNGAVLAPFPPYASYFDTADFPSGTLLASAIVTDNGMVVGSGPGAQGTGAITMLGSPTTLALDPYRLVGLDGAGNILFDTPSTTKTTFEGGSAPVDEGAATNQNAGQYVTQQSPFNRPSSLQKVDQSNVLIADTGNDRVVECDTGGNVVSETAQFFDPLAPYQPGDFYLVDATTQTYSIANGRLSSPTDAYQWTANYTDAQGNAILATYSLIVDADNNRIVLLTDQVYPSGVNKGQYVSLGQRTGPTNTAVNIVAYHIKVWGTQAPASGAQYRYRNAFPYLLTDPTTQQPYMAACVATVVNYALTLKSTTQPGPPVWNELPGSSIAVLYGTAYPDPTTSAMTAYAPAYQGSVKAAAISYQDLRSDATSNVYAIQNPTFLRDFHDSNGNEHWLFINQGAAYTPVYGPAVAPPNANQAPWMSYTFRDTRIGNWGAYDFNIGSLANAASLLQGTFTNNFVPAADGALDSVDYANLTLNFAASPDPYYALPYPPESILPSAPGDVPAAAFVPTSIQYIPLTGSVLISNGVLNQLADPTVTPIVLNNPFEENPARMLGTGGEVFVVRDTDFFHAAVASTASATYQPDTAVLPSIVFRSIPVKGSYLLQQVVAGAR